MRKLFKNKKVRKGFNLIELIIVIAAGAILTVTIGVFLANGQRNWNSLYRRVYGDSAVDGFAAHKVFDSICRKASLRKYVIGDDSDTLELYYWDAGSTASTPENYGRFYVQDNVLYVEHGLLQSGSWSPDTFAASTVIQIASQVESVNFDIQGTSIQMFLTYEGEDTMPVISSAVRHNN